MKIGIRKPSIKKSIKARTTAKVKRAVKSSVNPLYGKKGMGYINDPKKAVYNKIYNKITVGARDLLDDSETNNRYEKPQMNTLGCLGAILQLTAAFGQLIIYGAMLIALIWFIIQIVKL